jgi:hypothetical protein
MTHWKCFYVNASIEMFVTMSKYLQENDCEFEEIKPPVPTHITNLERNFNCRFSDLTLSQNEWIRNPLAVTVGEKTNHLSIKSQDSLVKLACDTFLKFSLKLSQLATDVLLLFGTAHPCKKTCSAMAAIKSKYRN